MKLVKCFAVSISILMQAVAWASPSIPPPPPEDFPIEVEGYDAHRLYALYAAITRESIRLAREDLIEKLLIEVSDHVLRDVGGNVTPAMSVELSSEFEPGNRLMVIYSLCEAAGQKGECESIALLSGPVTTYGTEAELMNNFDVDAAVAWLQEQRIAPHDLDRTSLTELAYLGQQNPIDAYKNALRAITLNDAQCPQMREAVEDLKSSALAFQGNGEIPWPHGGFATVQFLEKGDAAEPVSVVGFNHQPIMLAVVEFSDMIDKCVNGLNVQ